MLNKITKAVVSAIRGSTGYYKGSAQGDYPGHFSKDVVLDAHDQLSRARQNLTEARASYEAERELDPAALKPLFFIQFAATCLWSIAAVGMMSYLDSSQIFARVTEAAFFMFAGLSAVSTLKIHFLKSELIELAKIRAERGDEIADGHSLRVHELMKKWRVVS